VRELYRTIQTTSQEATRTQTQQTMGESWEEVTQTQTRDCPAFRSCKDWSEWSPSLTNVNTSWQIQSIPNGNSSPSVSDPSLGSSTPTSNIIKQECNQWSANDSCTNWISSSKQATDFPNVTSTTTTSPLE
ncbi:hypothetical protein RJJ65_39025, partial [Rhizobium hidalgonense]